MEGKAPAAETGSPISTGEVGPLSVAKKVSLAAEILLAYGRVRWAMRTSDLPHAVEDIRAPRRWRSRRPLADATQEGRRLGAAVVRTLEPLPVDSRCLMRSLVLLRVLGRRGVHGSLVIAVRPGEGLKLAAHAWVEADGLPLLVPAGADHGRLVTL